MRLFQLNAVIAAIGLAVLASAPATAASYVYRQASPGLQSATCSAPGGAALFQGDTVVAYSSATVPYGDNCVSEIRICDKGTLSETFAHAACTPNGVLNPSDGTTVVSGTGPYVFSNSNNQAMPQGNSTLSGGLMSPACKGDFTFSFTSSKIASRTGEFGITVVDSNRKNLVSAMYEGALVEQAWYVGYDIGLPLLRRFTPNYAWTTATGSEVNYTISRTGNTLTALVSSTNSEQASYPISPPSAAHVYLYYVKDQNVGAVTISNPTFNCPGG